MSSAHKETVAIVRSDGDIAAAVRNAIALAGGFPDVAGKKVVLKPNLVCPDLSGRGMVTDCRVVEAVARVALEAGAKVTIAEGSAVGFITTTDQNETFEAADVSGLTAVARKLGVPLVDLNRDPYDEVPVQSPYGLPTIPFTKTLAEADLIVSIPIIKSHFFCGLTLSCKNFQGTMPWRNKRRTHRVAVDAGLSDIYSVVKPGFAVVDGTVAHSSKGVFPTNLIVAGRDCVAVDATIARAVGFPPDRIGHLRYNAERGLGVIADDQIEVKGLSIGSASEILQAPWDWPLNNNPIKSNPQVDWVVPDPFPCSGYTYAAQIACIEIKTAFGPEPLKGLRIALGEAPARADKVKVDLVVGDAAGEWATGTAEVLDRCPKSAEVIAEICRLKDLDPAPIIAYRKHVPGSDWADIQAAYNAKKRS
jgi:uncharacterized protein (DUF362 family)